MFTMHYKSLLTLIDSVSSYLSVGLDVGADFTWMSIALPVMKWLLSRGKCKKFFPLNLDHICLLSDSIWKGPDLTVLGIWPLCYTWIGYLQANGPPGALLSKGVDHGFTCTHREVADNSNLEVITTLFRYCQIFVLLLAEICTPLLISACLYNTLWTVGCQELKPLLRCAALLTG